MLPGPSSTTTTAYDVARPGRASRPCGRPACQPTSTPARTKPRLLSELAGCLSHPLRAASQNSLPRPTSVPSHSPRAARYISPRETSPVPTARPTGRRSRRWSAPALGGRDEVQGPLAGVDLLGAGDLLLLSLAQLEPLGQPSRRTADGEQDREHLRRELEGLVDQAGVEVDVGVELALDEVLVLERDLLQLLGDLEERVRAGDLEDVHRGLLDDLGPGVVVLVDPVAE